MWDTRTDGQSNEYMPFPLGSIIKGEQQLLCVHLKDVRATGNSFINTE